LMSLEEDFLKKVKEIGYLVKMDTNGSFPDKLKYFIDKGFIDYVAMDIKGIKEDYGNIVNSKFDLKKIEESMKIASSLVEYEFRTTFVSRFHDMEKILEEIEWVYSIIGRKIKKFCLQGFKNHGEFIDESFSSEKNVLEKELMEIKEKILESGFVEKVVIRV
jgi:pyruvate formate lyase activating enzyme